MNKEYEDLFRPYFEGVECPEIHGVQPLISILMPYYNNLQYLKDCLDSIFDQTYQNWELMFVDDCSPDGGAEEVLAKYDDLRIRFFKMPENSGAAAARNAGFMASKGEYILCFDPDDVMHPYFLQSLMAEALSPQYPDIVIQDILCFGAINALWKETVRTERELTRTNWITGISLVKRAVWEVTGGQSLAPEIRYGSQDWEFWLHASEVYGRLTVGHVPLPIALYRRHAQATTSKSMFHEYAIRKFIYSKHPDIFDRYGTAQRFLIDGYIESICAHARVRNWDTVLKVFAEGVSTLQRPCFLFTLSKEMTKIARRVLKRRVSFCVQKIGMG